MRFRLGLVQGEAKYDDLEKRLAWVRSLPCPPLRLRVMPTMDYIIRTKVPSAINSRANMHTEITGGIGHNLAQEAPQAFAQAIVDVDRLSG
jgi:hypothetical protein